MSLSGEPMQCTISILLGSQYNLSTKYGNMFDDFRILKTFVVHYRSTFLSHLENMGESCGACTEAEDDEVNKLFDVQ